MNRLLKNNFTWLQSDFLTERGAKLKFSRAKISLLNSFLGSSSSFVLIFSSSQIKPRRNSAMSIDKFDFKIFDSLLEPVFVIDDKQTILYCNEPAAIISDVSVRKIIRQKMTFEQLLQFSNPIELLLNLSNITEPSPYIEISFQSCAGKIGKTQLTIQPLGHDAHNAWLIYFRDVTLEETLQKKYRAELDQKEGVIKDLQKAQAELEKYSQNLEQMVEERSQQILNLNRLMTALLNSLEQGFFVFNSDGLVLEVCSKAAIDMLQSPPQGRFIWDVLSLPQHQIEGLKRWMLTLFSEMLPFEDLAPLGPNKLLTKNDDQNQNEKHIKLEYYPLRKGQSLDAVVVVATDITRLIAAETAAAQDRAHAQMILSLIKYKRQALSFMSEAQQLMNLVQTLFKTNELKADELFISLHTIKGGAASFSIESISSQAHHCEDLLTTWRMEPSPKNTENLKLACESMINKWQVFAESSEAILGQWQKHSSRMVEIATDQLLQFENKLNESNLKKEFSQQFLMSPIVDFFTQYDEVTQSVAEREGKSLAAISFQGGDLRILPEPYESLFATFIHAFRNAVDHGLETPSERQANGKDPIGKIHVEFSRTTEAQKSFLQIAIQDDGRGISSERIKAKLLEKNIDCANESEHQIIQHVFDSEFSTKDQATDISGRGVGMDAIQKSAIKLGGSAEVFSSPGAGTKLIVKVPDFFDLQSFKKSNSKNHLAA